MKWFGKNWGAPCCEPSEQVTTPTGSPCVVCEKPIGKDGQGFAFPLVRGFTKPVPGMVGIGVETVVYHLDCMLHAAGARGYPCTHPKKP